MNDRILERVVAETTPSPLNEAELELDVQPLTRPPRAMSVTAWVRYGKTSVRVEGRAVAT